MLAVVGRGLERKLLGSVPPPVVRSLRTRASLYADAPTPHAQGTGSVVITPIRPVNAQPIRTYRSASAVVTPVTTPNTAYSSTPPPSPPPPPPPSTPPPSQPTQTSTVIVSPPPSSPPPSPRAPRSSFRSRLTSFLVGVGLTSVVGYYRLQSDIWTSAAALEGQVSAMAMELAASRSLVAQVQQLEKRLNELEKDKGKTASK